MRMRVFMLAMPFRGSRRGVPPYETAASAQSEPLRFRWDNFPCAERQGGKRPPRPSKGANGGLFSCHFLEVMDNSCFWAVGSDRRGRTAAPEVTFGTVFCSVLALVTQSERFLLSKKHSIYGTFGLRDHQNSSFRATFFKENRVFIRIG